MLEEQLCNKSTEDHESSLVIVNRDEVGVTNEQFNALAKSWESTINEKEKEIEYLRNKYQEYQAIENTRDLLEDRIKNLELEIEDYHQQRNEWQQKYVFWLKFGGPVIKITTLFLQEFFKRGNYSIKNSTIFPLFTTSSNAHHFDLKGRQSDKFFIIVIPFQGVQRKEH